MCALPAVFMSRICRFLMLISFATQFDFLSFKGRMLVGHAIHNDLAALQMSHPRKLIRDTAKYPPLMREPRPGRKPKPRALRKLAAEQLGLEIQSGEHSPVDDARCALYLYHKHQKVRSTGFSVHAAPCRCRFITPPRPLDWKHGFLASLRHCTKYDHGVLLLALTCL